MHARHLPAGLALLGALALAGCVNLEPVAPTTRFYTLVPAVSGADAPAPGPEAARVGVRVTVQADYLRRPAMAVRVSANEMRFADNHRWAERVDEGIGRALTLALQQRRPEVLVAPVAGGTASGAATIIDVAIVACEGTAEGGAALEGYWKINTLDTTTPVATGHFRRTRAGWDGADYGALAGLLGELIDELAAEIEPATR